MSEPSLSAYVARCQQTLAEYSRLRFLGVSHETAHKMSGFMEAVTGKPIDQAEQLRDLRKIIAHDEDA